MMQDAIREYLRAVEVELKTGIAAEHAYRPALERLLESIEHGLNAVNDPKRSEIGAPDFQVQRHDTTIGFVEAKDIGVNLNNVEKTEQMGRYFAGLGNLILTDYLEFRWYVKGEHKQTVRIASVDKKRIQADETQFDNLTHLLNSFVQVIVPTVNTARELAHRMAANAHLIRDLIFNDLESKQPSTNLVGQREAFKKTLLPDINNAQFADMYAQTIAYGLFAARVNYAGNPDQFSRRGAGEDIPRTNPFLRKLFGTIGLDLGERVTFLVDVLADLLARTDTEEILKDFGKATRQHDPIVHFYETFLSEYDPRLREQRGVYYTPEPVVSYIVRSVDHVLRERFGRGDGLADTNTMILDPATGTGTFLYFVMRQIHEAFAGQAGAWSGYVRDHLLRRIFGFELLMAPYAMAHMKLGLLLNELKYTFSSDQRLGVYLTNTLEEAKKTSETMFAQFISEEADEAAAVKRDKPIMVVLGNPPYSGISANMGAWIEGLLKGKLPDGTNVPSYYEIDGKPLGERKVWLQNDYIKFIRFGQWRIDKTGSGVLAFITDNSYLDGVTFRGMRQQLMQAFDDIYIVNLHGNSNKKETSPDGSPDKNVFDIQQGVTISIFIKEKGTSSLAKVHYLDLWGQREGKYQWLFNNDISTTEFLDLEPSSPYYFFVDLNLNFQDEYNAGFKLTDIIPINVTGIVTARDSFVLDFEDQPLKDRVRLFLDETVSDEVIKDRLNLSENYAWRVSEARKQLRSVENWEKCITTILYRPFNTRQIIYHPSVVWRTRGEVMSHVLAGENLALITTRQTRDKWDVLITDVIIGHKSVAAYDINSIFPLYLYPEKKAGELFSLDDDGSGWPLSDKGRRPNLNPQFVQDMADKLGLTFITEGRGDLQSTFGPEDIFAYAYAVFHSPAYRARYAEFLKIDFPRLPLTSDGDVFRTLVSKGVELVDLHLMRSPALGRLLTTYPVDGDNLVKAGHPKYTDEDQRVWINDKQYFEGVPPEVWAFHVGGYQVLDKWLKDRRERVLSYDDTRHYQRIVVALKETIRLMDEIDEAIPAWPLA